MIKRNGLLTVAFLAVSYAHASNIGTSGGLTLLEPSGARAAALGTAFSAMENDIGALQYNPASLQSLQQAHASFMYQKGVFEDAYSYFSVGGPVGRGSLGLSVGYYNSGDMRLIDDTGERTVTAQSDLHVALGMAKAWHGGSIGVTAKYLSSELAETASAHAMAADVGVKLSTSRLNFGLALQNFGTKLSYRDSGDPLPHLARAGMSATLFKGLHPTTLLVDIPYHMNEAEIRPAVGLEVMAGPMALRGGYQSRGSRQNLTVGTGVSVGGTSLDYAFAFARQLQVEHRVSVSSRFGTSRREPVLEDSRRSIFSLAMPD
jgi:hypothetical protein